MPDAMLLVRTPTLPDGVRIASALPLRSSASVRGEIERIDNDLFQIPISVPECKRFISDIDAGRIHGALREAGIAHFLEAFVDGECVYEHLPANDLQPSAMIDVDGKVMGKIIGHVQVVVMTATQLECATLRGIMKPVPASDGTFRGSLNTQFGPLIFTVGMIGKYLVAHVQCTMGSQASCSSQISCQRAIIGLSPKLVVVMGIAFGMDRRRQRLGDILIAETIMPYELAKLRVNGTDYRGAALPAGTTVVQTFREYADGWKLERSRSKVAIHFGLVLSGEKVIDDDEIKRKLADRFKDAIGGEMEGVGVYASAREAKVDAILIKGICDWADGTKSDHAQPFATFAASDLMRHVFDRNSLASLECTACTYPGFLAILFGRWPRVRIKQPKPSAGSCGKGMLVLDTSYEHVSQMQREEFEEWLQAVMRAASGDPELVIDRVLEGSLVVEFTSTQDSQSKLKKLYEAGELARILGYPIKHLHVYAEKLLAVPDIFRKDRHHLRQVVCHVGSIAGFVDEGLRAKLLVGASTTLLANCKVFVTTKDGIVYAHSNFIKPKRADTTKVAVEGETELFFLFVNLVCDEVPSKHELLRLFKIHRAVEYFIEEYPDGFDLQGARNVRYLAKT